MEKSELFLDLCIFCLKLEGLLRKRRLGAFRDAEIAFQLRGTGPGRKNVLRFVPPMTTTDVEIDRALSIVNDALKTVA